MLKPTATITTEVFSDMGPETRIHVEVTWGGADLDRPSTGGFILGPVSMSGKMKLAQRLVRAIDEGAVYTDPKVVKDVNGKTYVQAHCKVMGKYLNAALKRLGY